MRITLQLAFALICFSSGLAAQAAAPPDDTTPSLQERLDRAIEANIQGKPAPRASDAEFVRRVYLDLTGKIPSIEAYHAFLADTTSDKRVGLIDGLLSSPEYARRMQQVFDVMLMQRRSSQSVPAAAWQEYLRRSFQENKPYNELVGEILGADGTGQRAPARFYLDRGGDPNLLTRDIGRLFFGMDLQCAQCHDHPMIADYYEADYYGIYAFLNRSFVFTDAKAKKTYFAEKAEGEVAYKSVFDASVDVKDFRPRLPRGEIVKEPVFGKGQAYFVKPAKNVRPIPKFSRRAQLAKLAAAGSNRNFNLNIVNRLWALMMGRGLVHPVGLHYEDNPPSHPELLDTLAEEFVASGYDVRAMLRTLALSATYQRSSVIPVGMSDEDLAPERYAVAILKPLSAEQLAWSLMEATGQCEAHRQAAKRLVSGDPRLAAIYETDAKRRYLRDETIEAYVYGKLNGVVGSFASLYGGAEGEPEQDFSATVHQALFLSNGSTVRGWLKPSGANVMGRVQKLADPRRAADELYQAILSRDPSEEERLEVAEYLVRRAETPLAGAREIAWALLASAEFRFNH